MMDTAAIDQTISRSLTSFATDLAKSEWHLRREREAISFYAFRYLLREVQPDSFLHDSAQIGIEVPVPQVTELGKGQVCKDLVIWPEPMMTCWDDSGKPTRAPTVILEWKFNVGPEESKYDIDWLERFTANYPACQGYSVRVDHRDGRPFLLTCARVVSGQTEPRWLHLVDVIHDPTLIGHR